MNKLIEELVKKNIDKNHRFFKEVFEGEIYKPTINRGKLRTVIDLGAFHGEFSFYIYDLADKIYAIEPHPDAFKNLVKNCKGLNKIIPAQLIVSNSNGYKWISGNEDGGSHTTDDGIETELKHKVKSKTLATFIKENHIDNVDILKIDIEDHEPYVFGSDDFKEIANKIKFIMGEHIGNSRVILEKYGFEYKETDYGPICEKI